MRKQQQLQILEIIKTIESAQAAELYADCQECAISIGEFIEDIEGEGTQTVTLLEEYCELLYKASIGEAGAKTLSKQLIRVENSIKNELKPTRIEIVFLSYKASMSDSLESVYLAAKDDPACDAYWIPIPYYDKKPDGSFDVMQYEGAEFYKDKIVCTDYHEYNIEERLPDVIFTFAPYDNFGNMTSVHPDYYCERLRELTDLLVYIPYFVVTESLGGSFTKCAAAAYAHLIIVQSEEVRQCYIRDYKEVVDLGFSQKEYGRAEDKFIALGSPKFDAVVNAKREDYVLPQEWQELIAGKKVIFFNTSIGIILNAGAQYLKKLRFVHETFKNLDDVVLWWRPHPLSEVAYTSMEPELADEYKRIVEEYKQEAFGIYDDTPDLHRAITWSDAFFGDPSSIINLFQITGKPVLISDSSVMDNAFRFRPTGVFPGKDCLYFLITKINTLLCMNRTDWSFKIIDKLPEDMYMLKVENKETYLLLINRYNTIYFPPNNNNEVFTLSLESKRLSDALPEDYKLTFSQSEHFLYAICCGDYGIIAQIDYPAIIRMNIITNKITYHTDWLNSLKELLGDTNEYRLNYPSHAEGLIWFTVANSNAIMSFNMKTSQHAIYRIGKEEYRFSFILFDENNYWLSPVNGTMTSIIKWNPEDGILKEFPINEEESFFTAIYEDDFIWLISLSYSESYKIDIHTDSISIVEELKLIPPVNKLERLSRRYSFAKLIFNNIYAYDLLSSILTDINSKKNNIKKERLQLPHDISEHLDDLYLDFILNKPDEINELRDCSYNEGLDISLNCFINLLNEKNNIEAEIIKQRRTAVAQSITVSPNGEAGAKILDHIKKLMF